MRILFHATGGKPDPWLADLTDAIPGAEVRAWQDGDHAPADYAVVWQPPRAMLQNRSGLKAIFNLGAGVDGIMALADALPARVPVLVKRMSWLAPVAPEAKAPVKLGEMVWVKESVALTVKYSAGRAMPWKEPWKE